MTSSAVTKYPLPMRVLHWAMAILIALELVAGLLMVHRYDQTAAVVGDLYPVHKSVGLLILLLVVWRMVVRWRSAVPQLPASLQNWEKISAHIGHGLLYLLIIVVPILGYSMSSTFTQSDGVTFFGLPVPELLPKNDAQFEVFQLLHRVGAYVLLGVVVVHVLAVLKHRFFDRNHAGANDSDVLSRML